MFFLTRLLWVSAHVLLIPCLVAIFLRRRQTELPFFTAYLLVEFTHFLALFLISLQSPFPRYPYHLVLAVGEAISTLLALAVIYELAERLIFSHLSIGSFFRSTLRWSLAALVLLSALGSGSFADVSVRHIMNILERVDFVSNLILTGTLLNLLFLSHVLKVSWRGWITGIAVGFGIYAAIGLIAAALRAELGVEALVAVDITQMAGLNICVIIWVIYLFLPERPFPNSGTGLAKSELEIWSKELEKLVSNQ